MLGEHRLQPRRTGPNRTDDEDVSLGSGHREPASTMVSHVPLVGVPGRTNAGPSTRARPRNSSRFASAFAIPAARARAASPVRPRPRRRIRRASPPAIGRVMTAGNPTASTSSSDAEIPHWMSRRFGTAALRARPRGGVPGKPRSSPRMCPSGCAGRRLRPTRLARVGGHDARKIECARPPSRRAGRASARPGPSPAGTRRERPRSPRRAHRSRARAATRPKRSATRPCESGRPERCGRGDPARPRSARRIARRRRPDGAGRRAACTARAWRAPSSRIGNEHLARAAPPAASSAGHRHLMHDPDGRKTDAERSALRAEELFDRQVAKERRARIGGRDRWRAGRRSGRQAVPCVPSLAELAVEPAGRRPVARRDRRHPAGGSPSSIAGEVRRGGGAIETGDERKAVRGADAVERTRCGQRWSASSAGAHSRRSPARPRPSTSRSAASTCPQPALAARPARPRVLACRRSGEPGPGAAALSTGERRELGISAKRVEERAPLRAAASDRPRRACETYGSRICAAAIGPAFVVVTHVVRSVALPVQIERLRTHPEPRTFEQQPHTESPARRATRRTRDSRRPGPGVHGEEIVAEATGVSYMRSTSAMSTVPRSQNHECVGCSADEREDSGSRPVQRRPSRPSRP